MFLTGVFAGDFFHDRLRNSDGRDCPGEIRREKEYNPVQEHDKIIKDRTEFCRCRKTLFGRKINACSSALKNTQNTGFKGSACIIKSDGGLMSRHLFRSKYLKTGMNDENRNYL